jgi:hypothetical protein
MVLAETGRDGVMAAEKHPIQVAIGELARKATRWQRHRALLRLVASSLLIAVTIALIDFTWRIQDVGVRIVMSLVWFIATCGLTWKWLYPAWKYPWSEFEVAQRVEQRWPELRNRLSSSLAFLSQSEDDPVAGSASLRRAVVVQTEVELNRYDLNSVLDIRRVTRSLKYLGIVMGAVALFAVWRPADVLRSAQRMFVPWNPVSWPRENDLVFVTPKDNTLIAKGSRLTFRVADKNGELPRSVTLEVVFDDEGDHALGTREFAMDFRGGEMVKSIENVTSSFRYRVYGGDDDRREWRAVKVIAPPGISNAEISSYPPAYTGWPMQRESGNAKVLEGTHLRIEGASTIPVQEALLMLQSGEGEVVRRSLLVDASGRKFSMPTDSESSWVATETLTYWLELVSKEGIRTFDEERWQLSVLPDRPPAVLYREPLPTDILPNATMSIELMARDDLAVHTVEIRYLRSDQSELGEQRIELYRGPEIVAQGTEPSPDAAGTSELAGMRSIANEDVELISHRWALTDLAGLDAGVTLTVSAIATDYKGQESATNGIRVRIVAESTLVDGISERHSTLLAQLREIVVRQRTILEHTEDAQRLWGDEQDADRRNLDQLQAIDLNQRELQGRLVVRDDAIVAQVHALLRQLELNQLRRSEVGVRLQNMANTLEAIDRESLDPLQRLLTSSLKQVQNDPSLRGATIAANLGSAAQIQQQIIRQLESLIDEQAVFDNLRQFASEASTLLDDQRQLNGKLLEARLAESNGRELHELSSVERESLARRQSDLAHRFDKFRLRMQAGLDQAATRDANIIAALDNALEVANREAIGGRMRQTSGTIRQGQLGRAMTEQAELAGALEQVVQQLQRSTQSESVGLTEKLQDAQVALEDLLEKQKGLREKSEQMRDQRMSSNATERAQDSQKLEELRREREQLEKNTRELAERLARLMAEQAAQQTSQAAQSMQQANEQQQAGNQSGAVSADQQAERQLQEAQQQLSNAKQQEEQRLRDRQMARLEQLARGWLEQQQALLQDTQRLNELHQSNNPWTAGQRDSLHQLSQLQHLLAEDIASREELLDGSEVFGLALQSARHQMTLAGDSLESESQAERPTEPLASVPGDSNSPQLKAIVPQQGAIRRLDQVLAALAQAPPPENPLESEQQEPAPENQGDGESPEGPPSSASSIRSIEELKLLKEMQLDLAERTLELDQARQERGRLSTEEQQELEYLAAEQGALAKIVEDLLRRAMQASQEQATPTSDGSDRDAANPDEGAPDSLERQLEESLLDQVEKSLQ